MIIESGLMRYLKQRMVFLRFAEVARSSGAASVENVFRTVERLETVRALGLKSELLADLNPDIVDRFGLRSGTADPWNMRRHPDETRYVLLGFFILRAVELTDTLGDLLISITHKIPARAETKVIRELVADYRKVEGKTAILFMMVLAADAEPTGRVCVVFFRSSANRQLAILPLNINRKTLFLHPAFIAKYADPMRSIIGASCP